MKKTNLALGIGGAVGAVIAWKMLSRAGEVVWEDVADKVPHSENSHFAEVDGSTVHYQEFGEKSDPTLILIHGYTASTYVWNRVAPMLADEGFHVVAVDLLGFGYSDKPAAFDYTIASQARMIARLMNRLGIGQAIFAGSSYGGAVASVVALDYPERVSKLVLVGSVCNDDVKRNPLLRLAAIPVIGEIVSPFLLDSKSFLKFRMKESLAPESRHLINEERVEAVSRPLRAKNAHHSVLASARNWDACRIEADAQFIKQPTLLVWGESDKVVPVGNGEKLYDSILDSRLIVFKNCGHVPQEEKPELFTRVVTDFCRGSKNRNREETGEESEIRSAK